MDTADAFHYPFKKFWNQVLDLIDFTHFQHFLKLGQEQGLLDAVGERPVLEQSFEQWNGEGPILGQEKHGAPEQLLVELRACLDLVQRNDDILKKDYMLFPQGDSEATNDTC